MARHAVVDLALIFGTPPEKDEEERLPSLQLQALRQNLAEAGLRLREGATVDQSLAELRGMYEPYLHSLSRYFRITLPPWMAEGHADNWQSSRWEQGAARARVRRRGGARDQHF
jgi:hypothetical protein